MRVGAVDVRDAPKLHVGGHRGPVVSAVGRAIQDSSHPANRSTGLTAVVQVVQYNEEGAMTVPVGEHGQVEWDVAAYERTANPRFGWSHEVLARLPLRGDETVIDAGCGPGTLTAELLERLPDGHVIALDISTNMLRVARSHLRPRYGDHVSFYRADLQTLNLHEVADAIFSRATFHWIRDHPRLFANLYRALQPGGWLVAQCGGEGNVARVFERVSALMASPHLGPSFLGWSDPLEWADARTTTEHLKGVGFVQVTASIESDRVVMPDAVHYAEFLRAVALRTHVAQIEDAHLQVLFLEELTRQGAEDEPPFVLDLRLLTMEAQRPV
jgi:trans-aconitate 2-methyltransferase